jgi:hypothetical protein
VAETVLSPIAATEDGAVPEARPATVEAAKTDVKVKPAFKVNRVSSETCLMVILLSS